MYPKDVPQQQNFVNCGIYSECTCSGHGQGDDCGQIDPALWRIWFAGEAIAEGWQDCTHAHTNIIPEEQLWSMCLWRYQDSVEMYAEQEGEEEEED